ncbi:MAG: CCA tRNA nucleotidyltransferase [Candidatus Kapaibacterium sp.]
MTLELNEPILRELARLASEKHVELYVVGGYVRDLLMQRPRTDLDFTVVGDAIAFARDVAAHFHSKAVIYERFRTALVPVGEYHLEFVGTRKDTYHPDSRNPVVTEGTLRDDILRRDFTVNSMALSLGDGSFGGLVDLCGGVRDLDARLLRTPLDPVTTFNDDPLRMMRACRFASQLGFTLHPDALEAIRTMADRIKIIAQERVSDEFMKIMASPRPSVGLNALHDTGLLPFVFPEVERLHGVDLVKKGSREFHHKDVFYHTLQVVDNVAAVSDDVWLRFATLMHDIAKPKTKRFIDGVGWTFHGHEEFGARWQDRIFRRMKLPLEHLPMVETLVRLHQRPMMLVDEGVTDSAIRRLAVHAGEWIDELFILCRADVTTSNENRQRRYLKNYEIVYQKIVDVRERDQLAAFQSPVRGELIMEVCGLPPSRAVGIIKNNIEEAILDGIIPNDFDAAYAYMMEHKDAWIGSLGAAS